MEPGSKSGSNNSRNYLRQATLACGIFMGLTVLANWMMKGCIGFRCGRDKVAKSLGHFAQG